MITWLSDIKKKKTLMIPLIICRHEDGFLPNENNSIIFLPTFIFMYLFF